MNTRRASFADILENCIALFWLARDVLPIGILHDGLSDFRQICSSTVNAVSIRYNRIVFLQTGHTLNGTLQEATHANGHGMA